MSKDKNWKSNLLSSGIPLEHEIAKQVNDIGFGVWGEFTYPRITENNIEKNFTVDIWAVKDIDNPTTEASLSVSSIIECKYAHPGKKWIFVPNYSSHFENVVTTVDYSSSFKLTDRSLKKTFNGEYDICLKGVELQNKEASDYIIKKGINQLSYALPNLLKYNLSIQFLVNRTSIRTIIPILLTTCDLYVLKHDITLEDFLNSDNLKEVAEKKDGLIYYQHSNPTLENYSEKVLRKFYSEEPTFFEDYKKLYHLKTGNNYETPENFLKRSFNQAHRKILVCNISELQNILLELCSKVEKTNFEKVKDWA